MDPSITMEIRKTVADVMPVGRDASILVPGVGIHRNVIKGVRSTQPVERNRDCHTGYQRTSEDVREHQKTSEDIRGYQKISENIRGYQKTSEDIREHIYNLI